MPLVLIQRALALPTLREQALSDHKTGLLNSRGIDQPARREFARAQRLGQPLSVLLCDIDDLRGINNRLGHLEGDAALVVVSAAFKAELRAYDLCARFGGDEFLVVLPETDEEEAVVVAERIQAWLAENPLPTSEGMLAVGISIGVGTLQRGRAGDRNDARARRRRDVRGKARRRPLVPDRRLSAATIPATRAVSSVGRAPARQAGGHWFEPSTAHFPRASVDACRTA